VDLVHLIKNKIGPLPNQRGFTLIEIIAVLILAGIIMAVIINRVIGVSDTSKFTQASVVKNHIRYAQSLAMKQAHIYGVKSDGTHYWLFRTNNPDNTGNQIAFAAENDKKVTLSDKKMTLSSFTLYFDDLGRPYSAYTDAGNNTPVSSTNPLSITVNSVPATGALTFNVTPETGFIP
jgi:MSHA pilin protein MshC